MADKIGKTINDIIWEIITWTGFVLSLPVWALAHILHWPTIKRKDPFDRWTFAHIFATYLIADIMKVWFHYSGIVAGVIAFVIMYLYELLIDGNRFEDPEGFSFSDIGADFIGFMFYLLLHAKG